MIFVSGLNFVKNLEYRTLLLKDGAASVEPTKISA